MTRDRLLQVIDSLNNSEAVPAINAIRDLTTNLPDRYLPRTINEHLETLEAFVKEVSEFCDALETDAVELSRYKPEAAALYDGTPGSGSLKRHE